MARRHHTPRLATTEEAVIVLFCLIDEASYARLNPHARRYESLKRLSDSEVITLALVQQLRGVESERSFLRDAVRFFSPLFPGVLGLAPSSLHRRVRKPRCFLEPSRRSVVAELVGEPETFCSSTRRYSRCRTPGGWGSPRASKARRGRGGAPSRSTG